MRATALLSCCTCCTCAMRTAACICNCIRLLMSPTYIGSTRVQLMRRTYHMIFNTRLSVRIRSPSSLYRCLCVGCLVCSLNISCSIVVFCLMRFQLVVLLAYMLLLKPGDRDIPYDSQHLSSLTVGQALDVTEQQAWRWCLQSSCLAVLRE